jgi:hypothetical protein
VVPYDLASSRDLQMVENLQGWSRTYGDRHHQTIIMPFQQVEKYAKWDSGLDRLKTDEKSKH